MTRGSPEVIRNRKGYGIVGRNNPHGPGEPKRNCKKIRNPFACQEEKPDCWRAPPRKAENKSCWTRERGSWLTRGGNRQNCRREGQRSDRDRKKNTEGGVKIHPQEELQSVDFDWDLRVEKNRGVKQTYFLRWGRPFS